MGYIPSKKTLAHGILFDSSDEAAYYDHLLKDHAVEGVVLQPKYTLLEPFTVECSKCKGKGKIPSPKTGKPIKCRTCEGTGEKGRQSWTYKADFLVKYRDGHEEVVDVKGFANERFPLVRKMWENQTGKELIVVKKTKQGWVRK